MTPPSLTVAREILSDTMVNARVGDPRQQAIAASIDAVLAELGLLTAMREALDRAAAENMTGDPTELARRVSEENNNGPIAYALARQVIRDHQHTLQLLAELDRRSSVHGAASVITVSVDAPAGRDESLGKCTGCAVPLHRGDQVNRVGADARPWHTQCLVRSMTGTVAALNRYIDDAKRAGAGDRVSGEPLADYIERLRGIAPPARREMCCGRAMVAHGAAHNGVITLVCTGCQSTRDVATLAAATAPTAILIGSLPGVRQIQSREDAREAFGRHDGDAVWDAFGRAQPVFVAPVPEAVNFKAEPAHKLGPDAVAVSNEQRTATHGTAIPPDALVADMLPCPFCRGQTLSVSMHTGSDPPQVRCRDCGARGPHARSDANREAIANWNRRPAPAAGLRRPPYCASTRTDGATGSTVMCNLQPGHAGEHWSPAGAGYRW